MNLTFHSGHVAQCMVDAGAVEHVLTALEWHPTSPAVLVKGLWALKNIAHVEAGADALIAAGGHGTYGVVPC